MTQATSVTPICRVCGLPIGNPACTACGSGGPATIETLCQNFASEFQDWLNLPDRNRANETLQSVARIILHRVASRLNLAPRLTPEELEAKIHRIYLDFPITGSGEGFKNLIRREFSGTAIASDGVDWKANKPDADKPVWLIERGHRQGQSPPMWWTGTAWSANATDAMQFSTKEEAETIGVRNRILSGISGVHPKTWEATEHMFIIASSTKPCAEASDGVDWKAKYDERSEQVSKLQQQNDELGIIARDQRWRAEAAERERDALAARVKELEAKQEGLLPLNAELIVKEREDCWRKVSRSLANHLAAIAELEDRNG